MTSVAAAESAYFRPPAQGRGVGVLLLHDMFGPSAVFHRLADRLAARGRCALLPDLFHDADPPGAMSYDGGHDPVWARLARLDLDRAVEELSGAADFLRRQPGCDGRVLVLGFCFSGRLAYRCATRIKVDAAVSFYALGISQDLGEAGRLGCALQLHYGLADKSVPVTEIDAVAAGLAGRPGVELYRYAGAGHSFFNPVRPMYDAAASELAEERMDALIARLGRSA